MNNSNGIYVSRQMYCIFIYLKSKEVKQQKISTLWQIHTTDIIRQAGTCPLPLEYTGKDAARRGCLLLPAGLSARTADMGPIFRRGSAALYGIHHRPAQGTSVRSTVPDQRQEKQCNQESYFFHFLPLDFDGCSAIILFNRTNYCGGKLSACFANSTL